MAYIALMQRITDKLLNCKACKKNVRYISIKGERMCSICYSVINQDFIYSENTNVSKNYNSRGQNYLMTQKKNQVHMSTMIDMKSRDSRGKNSSTNNSAFKMLYISQRKLNVTAGYNRNLDRVSEMLNQYKGPLGLSNLACANILKLYVDQVSGGFAKGKNANGILLACIYIHAIKKALPIKIEQLLPYAQIRSKRIFDYIRKLKKIAGLVNFKKDLGSYAAKYAKLVVNYMLAKKKFKNEL